MNYIFIVISGLGGHGIIFMGRLLANALAKAGFDVAMRPDYSPAQRGGWSRATLSVSKSSAPLPIADEYDVLIVTSEDRLIAEYPRLKYGGTLIYASDAVNSELVSKIVAQKNAKAYGIEAFSISKSLLGNLRHANMVLLGFSIPLLNQLGLMLRIEHLVEALREASARDFESNKRALEEGYRRAATAIPQQETA